MSLEVDQISSVSFVRRVTEMIETDAGQGSDRGESSDFLAQLIVRLVGLRYHHHRIPATERTNALLQRVISRRAFFHVCRNRVEIGRIEREGYVGARTARLLDELLQQIMGALWAFALENRRERIEPLLRFQGVGVVGGGEFRQRGHDVSL